MSYIIFYHVRAILITKTPSKKTVTPNFFIELDNLNLLEVDIICSKFRRVIPQQTSYNGLM